MADVIRNTSLLGADDRSAIAAYVASLPPRAGSDPAAEKVIGRYEAPNALKVMMVRVSAMPGMVCTFSAMKWPISVGWST